MTQDEIIEMAIQAELNLYVHNLTEKRYIEVIEAFAKLVAAKQIAELESQEPVGRFAKFTDGVWRPVTDYSAGVPLYTHPPQRTEQEPQIAINAQVVGYVEPPRTWVGLTDEHIIEIRKVLRGRGQQFDSVNDFVRAIEAKLKEKNCAG